MKRSETFYVSNAQHVNTQQYDVVVPAYVLAKEDLTYGESVETHWEQGIKITTTTTDHVGFMPRSFYHYDDPNARVSTTATIMDILKYYEDKVDCSIPSYVDTISIFFVVNDYLEEIRDAVFAREMEYVEFAKRMIKFRKEMYFHFTWAIRQNPLWREHTDIKFNSLNCRGLRALFGTNASRDPDGIQRLCKPPYSIEQIDKLFKPAEEPGRTVPGTHAAFQGGRTATLDDFVSGNKGVVTGNAANLQKRGSKDEQEAADIAKKYL